MYMVKNKVFEKLIFLYEVIILRPVNSKNRFVYLNWNMGSIRYVHR